MRSVNSMRLFIAEKPSLARAIADVLPNRTVKAMALSSAVMVGGDLVYRSPA
ncbi:hypothetical protein ACVXG8_24005 [Escherichia coli]